MVLGDKDGWQLWGVWLVSEIGRLGMVEWYNGDDEGKLLYCILTKCQQENWIIIMSFNNHTFQIYISLSGLHNSSLNDDDGN